MAECVKVERCGMAKKLIVVALAVVTISLVLGKTPLGGHVKEWVNDNLCCSKKEVTEEASLKKEIDALTKDVKSLEEEDATLVNLIAKDDVEIRKLKVRLGDLEETQKHNREVVRLRAANLQTVQKEAPSKGTALDEKNLENALKTAKLSDDAVANQKANIDLREQRVAALRQQRESLYVTQQELLNKLAELETRIVKLEIEQMKTPDPTDKSRVANIRRRIEGLDTRVEIREREKVVRTELTPAEKANTQPAATPKKDVVQDALNYLNDNDNNARK